MALIIFPLTAAILELLSRDDYKVPRYGDQQCHAIRSELHEK
jgi:hypothetical protein